MAGEYDAWLAVGTWALVLVTLAIVFITNHMQKKQQKETLQLEGLQMVYQILNTDDAIRARRSVYKSYYMHLKKDNLPYEFTVKTYQEHPTIDLAKEDDEVKWAIEKVRSAFEQIAVMEKNGLINEGAYFDAYWGTALRSYAAIHGHIEAIRKDSGMKHYSVYFQKQCEERMIKYWKENHSNSKIIYYGDSNVRTISMENVDLGDSAAGIR